MRPIHCAAWGLLLILPWPSPSGAVDATERETRSRLSAVEAAVDLEEHLGQVVDGDLPFIDDQGQTVRIGDYFGLGHPIVMILAYYNCPMLCGVVLRSATRGLGALPLQLGNDIKPSRSASIPATRLRQQSSSAGPPWPAADSLGSPSLRLHVPTRGRALGLF